MDHLTVTITFDASETTPDYLMHQVGGLDGVTDLTAEAPYSVVSTDANEQVAVLPNRQAAEDTMLRLAGDYYVAPAFDEKTVRYSEEEKRAEDWSE